MQNPNTRALKGKVELSGYYPISQAEGARVPCASRCQKYLPRAHQPTATTGRSRPINFTPPPTPRIQHAFSTWPTCVLCGRAAHTWGAGREGLHTKVYTLFLSFAMNLSKKRGYILLYEISTHYYHTCLRHLHVAFII